MHHDPQHSGEPAGSKGADGVFRSRHARLVAKQATSGVKKTMQGSGRETTWKRHVLRLVASPTNGPIFLRAGDAFVASTDPALPIATLLERC
jgi:hypothetical protein